MTARDGSRPATAAENRAYAARAKADPTWANEQQRLYSASTASHRKLARQKRRGRS